MSAAHSISPQDDKGARRAKWQRLLRLVLVALTLLILGSIGLRLAAPYLISNSLVRSALASAVSRWTGHDVFIADIPEITFWPEPEVTLTGITVSRGDGASRQILGEIDALSARFGFVSALRGQPKFNAFEFVRPRIRIERDAAGRLDWSNEGLLSEAVRSVAPSATGGQQIDVEMDADIGTVNVVDGQILLVDAISGRQFEALGVTAEIDWPRLSAPLSGTASFTYDAVPVELKLDTGAPLLLIGGQDASVSLSAMLPGMTGALVGSVNLLAGFSGTSDLDLTVTDMPAVVRLAGLRLAGTESWRSAALKTRLMKAEDEWRLEDLEFEINQSRGQGFLAVRKTPGSRPMLGGTLALGHLELEDLLQALSIGIDDRADVRLPSLTRWMDFDLRLSATTAALSRFELENVGASLIGRGDEMKLVIADSDFLGGSLSARISGSGDGFSQGADLAVMISDARLGDLAKGLALEGPVVTGIGSVDLNAKLAGAGWRRNIETMSGTLRVSANGGQLEGFDVDGVRRLALNRAYFQLSAAGTGRLEFDRFDMTAHFGAGSAEIERSLFVGSDQSLSLSGLIPYSREALALVGELTPSVTDTTSDTLRFFIGGGFADPVISPILPPRGIGP
ncbi:MAG: AsmA-like C-terminal region-containing protein [Rhizobium sp.]|nr:AsmA-like C-terminal region-containing protein [Rhizobium sp.]